MRNIEIQVSTSESVFSGVSIIQEGEPLKIACRIIILDPFALEWTKDDKKIDLSMVFVQPAVTMSEPAPLSK